MKRASNNYVKTKFVLMFGLLMGCQNNEELIPGTGEGTLGFAFVLGSGNNTLANARTLNTNLEITEGFIQIKELELEMKGRDENGRFEKELEIKFDDIRKVTFDQFDESNDFFINISEGEYEEIELELDLIDHRNEPSIYLEGIYSGQEEDTYQVIFEYFEDDIDFEVEIEAEDDDAYFRIDRVNNPLALLEINAHLWFRDISNAELDNARKENGIIRITKDINPSIYSQIVNRINDSSEIEIELR